MEWGLIKFLSFLCRSGVEPPTGKLHPRESRGTADKKQESMKRFVLEDALPGLELQGEIWRGWIVPVGGSTPDRLRADRLRPIQDGGEGMRIDEKVCFGGMSFRVWNWGRDLAGVDRSGRGFNPRPAQDRPA